MENRQMDRANYNQISSRDVIERLAMPRRKTVVRRRNGVTETINADVIKHNRKFYYLEWRYLSRSIDHLYTVGLEQNALYLGYKKLEI